MIECKMKIISMFYTLSVWCNWSRIKMHFSKSERGRSRFPKPTPSLTSVPLQFPWFTGCKQGKAKQSSGGSNPDYSLCLHYTTPCTVFIMQSNVIPILSRAKLFCCSSGFTFTWPTPTSTIYILFYTPTLLSHGPLPPLHGPLPWLTPTPAIHAQARPPRNHKAQHEIQITKLKNSKTNASIICRESIVGWNSSTLKSLHTVDLFPAEQFFGAIEQLFSWRKNCDDCVAHLCALGDFCDGLVGICPWSHFLFWDAEIFHIYQHMHLHGR